MKNEKTQHMPEPWKLLDAVAEFEIAPVDPYAHPFCKQLYTYIGRVHKRSYMDSMDDARMAEGVYKANAERIVACVNACQGISTEALNDNVVADMLEALTLIEWQIQRNDFSEAAEAVRKAIKKAKGQ